MRRSIIAAVVALLLAPAAWAALPTRPAEVALSEDEERALLEDGLVVRVEDTDLGARTTAVILVAAPPRATLEAVLDLPPRIDEIGSLKSVSVYAHEPSAVPEQMRVRFELSVVGRKVTFHTHYVIDRAAGWCAYLLDPEQENDLRYVDGAYAAIAADGGSRLVYQSTTQAGVSVPLWLRRMLVTGSLKDQLMGIKTRAERAHGASSM